MDQSNCADFRKDPSSPQLIAGVAKEYCLQSMYIEYGLLALVLLVNPTVVASCALHRVTAVAESRPASQGRD